MRRAVFLAAAIIAATPALAQPAPPSQTAQFAGALASNLATALTENDALRAQIKALQAGKDALKAKETTPVTK